MTAAVAGTVTAADADTDTAAVADAVLAVLLSAPFGVGFAPKTAYVPRKLLRCAAQLSWHLRRRGA